MTEENKLLFDIIKASLWGGFITQPIPDSVLWELRAQTVEDLTLAALPNAGSAKYRCVAQFVRMAAVQTEALRVLEEVQIPAAVIKGTASGKDYPVPYLRWYGDIDILVRPENYQKAIEALKQDGFIQKGDTGKNETHLFKNNQLVELHQSPPGLDRVKEGSFILHYLISGLDDIQQAEIAQPHCTFPILPWKQHGLELIWHIREHLYNGLGLRHIIDWMIFVDHYLRDDNQFDVFRSVLDKAGLLSLAKAVTKASQTYLGLAGDFLWCADVDENTCTELIEFILDQGNFGVKRTDDKAAKVLSRYHSPILFLKGIQQKGLNDWSAAQKHPALKPFAWIHTVIVAVKQYGFSKEGRQRLSEGSKENKKRKELFEHLYGGDVNPGKRVKKQPIPQRYVQRPDFRQRMRSLYERVKASPLRPPLYYLENLYFALRYPLFGKPEISEEDRANVGENVTFIYKSFNRQKKAEKLYHCIKAYYPNAQVVIADDSKQPLEIVNMAEGDTIIHLPFNTGISRGLIAALAEVKTPYTMRMDDDELLTPESNIHEQLAYLQKHSEVDLVGIQAKHHHPERGAAGYSRIRMNRRLTIPAGTVVDGREVVYKTANIFVARTDMLRKVGYDPNIYLIDHHEFFYRAAGQIVCVQDPHSYVLHCHNHFEKGDREGYRERLQQDMQYISRKHGTKNG